MLTTDDNASRIFCVIDNPRKSLILAAKTIATTALDLLTKNDALKAVQNEFKQRIKERTYKSPLPPDMKPPHERARKQAESYRPPE